MKYLRGTRVNYTAAAYTDDGRYLVSLHGRKCLRFWDVASFELKLAVTLADFPNVYQPIRKLTIVDRHAVVPCGLWDIGPALDWLADPTRARPVCPHVPLETTVGGEVLAVPRLQQVLLVTWGRATGFWDLGGRRVRAARFPSYPHLPAVSCDGQMAAVCSWKTVKLFEPGRPREAMKLEHTASVLRACFSPDGTQLATATRRNVWLW